MPFELVLTRIRQRRYVTPIHTSTYTFICNQAQRPRSQGDGGADKSAGAGDMAASGDGPSSSGRGDAQEAAGWEAGAADAQVDSNHNPNPFGVPLTLVKRIMCLDPDVARVSGDGLKAVAKAAVLMLELLTEKAAAQARS